MRSIIAKSSSFFLFSLLSLSQLSIDFINFTSFSTYSILSIATRIRFRAVGRFDIGNIHRPRRCMSDGEFLLAIVGFVQDKNVESVVMN